MDFSPVSGPSGSDETEQALSRPEGEDIKQLAPPPKPWVACIPAVPGAGIPLRHVTRECPSRWQTG